MSKELITKKMLENAHKVTYLVSQYPEHNMGQLISLLQMPAIEINTAFWTAQEMGYLTIPTEDGIVALVAPPEIYEFGEVETELETQIQFSFKKLNEKETDLEENSLGQWTSGYASHDTMIAMKRLLNSKVLGEYTIDDPILNKKGKQELDEDGKPAVNTYVFYSLYENMEQKWGRKWFKTDPLENFKKKQM